MKKKRVTTSLDYCVCMFFHPSQCKFVYVKVYEGIIIFTAQCHYRLMLNLLKKFHPRLTLVVVFVMFIVGSLLISDWQTIEEDPCNSIVHSNRNMTLKCDQRNSSCTAMDLTKEAAKLCQAAPGCYWNQISYISRTFCLACAPICRSKDHSLNFFQYTVGVFIFVFSIPVGDASFWVLISNNLKGYHQVSGDEGFIKDHGSLVGSFYWSCKCSIWYDWSYISDLE